MALTTDKLKNMTGQTLFYLFWMWQIFLLLLYIVSFSAVFDEGMPWHEELGWSYKTPWHYAFTLTVDIARSLLIVFISFKTQKKYLSLTVIVLAVLSLSDIIDFLNSPNL